MMRLFCYIILLSPDKWDNLFALYSLFQHVPRLDKENKISIYVTIFWCVDHYLCASLILDRGIFNINTTVSTSTCIDFISKENLSLNIDYSGDKLSHLSNFCYITWAYYSLLVWHIGLWHSRIELLSMNVNLLI